MADDDDHLFRYAAHFELETRIHALLRRSYGNFSKNIVCDRLILRIHRQQVFVNGEPLILFSREYGILELLMLQLGHGQQG